MSRRGRGNDDTKNACTLPDLRGILAVAETMREDTRQFKVLGDFLLVRREGNLLDLYGIEYVQTIDLERE